MDEYLAAVEDGLNRTLFFRSIPTWIRRGKEERRSGKLDDAAVGKGDERKNERRTTGVRPDLFWRERYERGREL